MSKQEKYNRFGLNVTFGSSIIDKFDLTFDLIAYEYSRIFGIDYRSTFKILKIYLLLHIFHKS